jgi:hypothetical protein
LPSAITKAVITPYHKRLCALLEIERVHEMMTRAAYAMERDVPDEKLALADRILFGGERPFRSAREAWIRLENELENWDTELEAERSALARSILGIEVGDIVTAQNSGRLLRLSVTGLTLSANDKDVTFMVNGRRFRKDGTLGKIEDRLWLHFENEK